MRVSMIMRSGVGSNHANDDINKSKLNEMERGRGSGLSLSKGNAQNIAAYKLIPDLQGDPFIVGYHVPQGVGQWRERDGGKRWGVLGICNTTSPTVTEESPAIKETSIFVKVISTSITAAQNSKNSMSSVIHHTNSL